MNFLCDKAEINVALNQVAKIIPSKAIIPAFEGILIEAAGNSCKLTAGNSQLTLNMNFKADVKEEGTVLVPGRLFCDIIRRSYDGDIEVSTDKGMTISSGNLHASIGIMDEDIYPSITLDGKSWSFEMEALDFKEAVRGSIFCAADENYINPIYTGIYITKEDDLIQFVALDGYRVAIKKAAAKGKDGIFLIPAKSLDEIAKSVGDEGKISFTVYDKYIKAQWEDVSIISVLFDKNEYSDYKGFIPKSCKTKIKVERSSILSSIERAATISRTKKSNLIILNVEDSVITFDAKSDIGEISDSVEIYQEGDPIKIGFNGMFLLDGIKSINDDEFYIEFDGQVIPCVMKPCSGDEYLYMILPMQI